MKRLLLRSLMIALTSLALTAGAVSALPLLNELAAPGHGLLFPDAPGIADSNVNGVYLTDTDGVDDTSVSTLYFAFGSYYDLNYLNFGIYDLNNYANTLALSTTTMPIGNATSVSFDVANGTATALGVTSDFGTAFGFYLYNSNSSQTFYTSDDRNADDFHYAGIYDTRSILGGAGNLTISDVIVAFEDVLGGGDEDYNDFVFGVTDVAPVPEPATMLLFGTGLIGLAGLNARRKKK